MIFLFRVVGIGGVFVFIGLRFFVFDILGMMFFGCGVGGELIF